MPWASLPAQTDAMSRELPPTAGLPLRLGDLMPGRIPLAPALARWLQVDEVQLECSGTAAMVITLDAMRTLRPDRAEVIVPAWTCPLVVFAIVRAGLVPRMCDVAQGHFDLDHTQLASLAGPQTLAIVPTHLAGRVADVASVQRVARECGAFVLEDAAQALGATIDGRSVGLEGDAGFFSLAVGKGLTTFEGGVLVTSDRVLREALIASRHKLVHADPRMATQRALELLGYALVYRPSLLSPAYGRPLRKALAAGDPVAAVGDDFGPDIPLHPLEPWRQSVGARALPRLRDFIEQTRRRAHRRVETLCGLPGVTVQTDVRDARGVWPFLLVTLPDEARRDAALGRLWTAGLGVSRLFIHALPDYAYLRGIVTDSDLPNARDFAARSLTITNSPWLRDEEFAHIVGVLADVVGRG